MSEARFAAVILAGGLSSRMKQLKPLLPLGDATVTDYAVSTFKSLGIDVFIVVGYRKEKITSGIKKQGLTIVNNPDFEKGMFSSIQAGVRELGNMFQAFFILPVDIPMVGATTIRQIMKAGNANPGKIIYPVFDGKRGHPPLVPSSLISEILSWEREGGLKSLLEKHANQAFEVAVKDSFILFDVDTPEDYKELLRRYRGRLKT
jgi:molybdenum cofactor cytidylyltransferase